MTSHTAPRTGNPYVGPTSVRLGDALYGRDQERDDLVNLLVAKRIVLFYSPSGAGKTSLIQAALTPSLQAAGFEVLPVIRVTHTLEPRPGLPTPRNRYVTSVLLSLEEGQSPEEQRPVAELAALTLREYLEAHADRDGKPGNEVLSSTNSRRCLSPTPPTSRPSTRSSRSSARRCETGTTGRCFPFGKPSSPPHSTSHSSRTPQVRGRYSG